MSGEEIKGSLSLTESYLYDGEQTTEIPYISKKHLGGAVLVTCPDGTERIFDTDEVVSDE